MKQIKIKPLVEKKVEQMFSLAQQISEIKKQYPGCWGVIKREFDLGDYYGNNEPQDTVENTKVRLYVEVIRKDNEAKFKKEQAVLKGLNRQKS